MNTSPEKLVSGAITLLSLPEVYLRLEEALLAPHSSAKDLGKILRYDPAIATRLLKIVNSAFYGLPAKTDSLPRAITIVGTHQLRELVLSTVAVATFNRISTDLVDMSTFWHHSVYCGLIARLLARRCHVLHPERLFTAGLLHDVGQLIIYHEIPQLAREALRSAEASDNGLYHAEQQVLGFTHGEVSLELFKLWNLPDSLQESTAFHHEPEKAIFFPLETALVHLANSAANQIEPARNILECRSEIDKEAWLRTGFDEEILQDSVTEAHPQFLQVIDIISPDRPMI